MCDYHVMPFHLQDNERPTVVFNVTQRDTVCQCSSWSGEEEYTSSYFCVMKEDDGKVIYCNQGNLGSPVTPPFDDSKGGYGGLPQ